MRGFLFLGPKNQGNKWSVCKSGWKKKGELKLKENSQNDSYHSNCQTICGQVCLFQSVNTAIFSFISIQKLFWLLNNYIESCTTNNKNIKKDRRETLYEKKIAFIFSVGLKFCINIFQFSRGEMFRITCAAKLVLN